MLLGGRLALGLVIWIGSVALQLTVMAIARFFERTSGQRTGYLWFLLPILLTSGGALRYLWRMPRASMWPDFTGDPLANGMFFVAGLLLVILGNALHDQMMGEPR